MDEFKIATYGTKDKATHAICACGVIAKRDENNHQCIWQKLISVKGKDDG